MGVDETGLRELFNRATDAIIVLDAHARVCFYNRSASTLFDASARDATGGPIISLLPTLPASHSDAGGRQQLLLHREGFEPLPARSCAIAIPRERNRSLR